MRRPLIGRKNFEASIRQGEQAQGRVMGGLPNVWMVSVFGRGLKTKDDKEYVKEK